MGEVQAKIYIRMIGLFPKHIKIISCMNIVEEKIFF